MSALDTPGLRRPLTGLTAEAVFVRRSLVQSLRDVESLLMAILLPVLMMVLFTFVFGGAIDPSGGYVDYVVPGIILLCAGFGSSSTATTVATDMNSGMISRLRTMPLRSSAVLTGHAIASLLRNLVATGVVVVAALIVGFRPSADALSWAAAIAVIALYILAITYLFTAIGIAAGSPAAATGYGFILLFAPYLSSAFVPVETMPDGLRWVAENQPITPIIETIRGLLMGTSSGTAPWWAVGWCLAILAVAVIWGSWLFRRKAGRRH
ncbi:ABC transporter permease [Microbacterium sp. W1N]|uniref:ABC transporter permease n=1 Tax=Microbacterium festucae TaxID=2977531 RepID=UPI0021BF60FE|nr:ABC transporter permease [Microbacterium festucae]MCT9820725.1 ABC transporter permease [Microbacterium festucae]